LKKEKIREQSQSTAISPTALKKHTGFPQDNYPVKLIEQN